MVVAIVSMRMVVSMSVIVIMVVRGRIVLIVIVVKIMTTVMIMVVMVMVDMIMIVIIVIVVKIMTVVMIMVVMVMVDMIMIVVKVARIVDMHQCLRFPGIDVEESVDKGNAVMRMSAFQVRVQGKTQAKDNQRPAGDDLGNRGEVLGQRSSRPDCNETNDR